MNRERDNLMRDQSDNLTQIPPPDSFPEVGDEFTADQGFQAVVTNVRREGMLLFVEGILNQQRDYHESLMFILSPELTIEDADRINFDCFGDEVQSLEDRPIFTDKNGYNWPSINGLCTEDWERKTFNQRVDSLLPGTLARLEKDRERSN